jgi:Ca2+-binding RTX toxin-like protein
MVQINQHDLEFILRQIKIAEANSIAHSGANAVALTDIWVDELGNVVPEGTPGATLALSAEHVPYGLRTVDGSFNNLGAGRENWGAVDQPFIDLLGDEWRVTDGDTFQIRTGQNSFTTIGGAYNPTGAVADADPRMISNLIVDQTLSNPAAIYTALLQAGYSGNVMSAVTAIKTQFDAALSAAKTANAGLPVTEQKTVAVLIANVTEALAPSITTSYGISFDGPSILIENVAPDEGLSAPYNSWFTLFGQFFDHGLDLVQKGGNEKIYIPLAPDDPLYVNGSFTNYMVLTRSPQTPLNLTTPFVDQNQTYSSVASKQLFLREYKMVDGKPVSTGHLLEGAKGIATWAEVKEQARDLLGIDLTDEYVGTVPLFLMDAYGEFVRGPNGFPQVRTANGWVEGNPDAPISLANAVLTNHAFLDDIAHNAVPGLVDHDRNPATPDVMKTADVDTVANNAIPLNAFGQATTYDNELLDAHFVTGDGRGNENIGLTAVHHIFHSEHNRIVEQVKAQAIAAAESGNFAFLNEWLATDVTALPSDPATLNWDGERLFQAARFTTEMQYQHLVFEEFARKIQPDVDAFVFNPSMDINPAIFAEFAHVVYRFGHSMLNETVDSIDADGNATSMDLFTAFLNPTAYAPGEITAEQGAGAVIRGMTGQAGNEIDEFVTDVLRNHLVGIPLDLAALNIARGRETGTPGLNAARAQFKAIANGDTQLDPYKNWVDFGMNLKNPASIVNFIAAYGTHATVAGATTAEAKREAAMKLVFGDSSLNEADRQAFLNGTGIYAGSLGGLNDVDLWVGGLAEKKMAFGGMLGSTFSFIFELQLENLQNGDRFYYLSRTQGLNLLNELEANSFAELVMRNTDIGASGYAVPGDIFSVPDHVLYVDLAEQAKWGYADPTGADPFQNALSPMVQRGANFLQFNSLDHALIQGTNQDDTIISGGGDDTVWGRGGNDRIEAGYGVDKVHGGEGDDIITNSGTDIGETDFLMGEEGNDVIHGGSGLALVFGNQGSDVLISGPDGKEMFGGEGDDFMLGGEGGDFLLGNEGDDWIEGGNGFDTTAGDNSELFFNSTILGHDVMFAGQNEHDFDAESGDDIMVQGESVMRNEGMWGYDWAIYKGNTESADADLKRPIFTTDQQDILRNRFDAVEGLSGYKQNDVLLGDDRATAFPATPDPEAEPGANLAGAENTMVKHHLSQAGIDRITGLRELLGNLVQNTATIGEAAREAEIAFDAGNILLGGGGSDLIEGRGGDDVIDGDAWLNVRIRISTPSQGTYTADSLAGPVYLESQLVNGEIPTGTAPAFGGKALSDLLLERAITPGQMEIVREIVNGGKTGDVDIAVYSDIRANYEFTQNADGSVTVEHVDVDPTGTLGLVTSDGTDRLTNIEAIRFGDGTTVSLSDLLNRPPVITSNGGGDSAAVSRPENATTVTTVTATELDAGQFLTYSISGGADAALFTIDPNTGVLSFVAAPNFEAPTDAGANNVYDVVVEVTDGIAVDTQALAVTVTNAQEGQSGAPVISDLTPTRTQQLSVDTTSITDPDGLGAFTYQWQVSADNGASWTNIPAATQPVITPVQAQVGNLMRVQVTYTDGSGALTTLNSVPTGVVGNVIASTPFLNDTITGTAGDDVISWTVRNPGLFGIVVGDGRDVVDGDAGNNDTFVVNGNNQNETYRVYARADWIALGGNRPLNANTEIVITRNGTANNNVIAELDNIEEIIINTGPGNDQVFAIGNFNPTSLNFNTITIDGSEGDDTVNISDLSSAHRILFRSAGGQDTIIGTLRSQDVVEIPAGADAADYALTVNGNGTKTLSNGTHSITFSGEVPQLQPPSDHGGSEPDPVTGPTGLFEYTARDIQGITNLVNGLPAFAGDDDTQGAVGVRDLSGAGNNIDNPAFGAADEPFIRLTEARYGAGVELDGQGNIINRALNPIFDGLDPRAISNAIGTQEANLPKAPNDANIFFMAFGQYFDHGLDFLPKGGAGKVIIDGADIPGPMAANFTDLTRGSLASPLESATDTPEHLNKTSPYVDQNQVYGSNIIVGQFLRESDGNGGVGSRILMGPEDPSAPGFHLMSTLRELLDHHRMAGTVFEGPGLGAGKTLLECYPTLWTEAGGYNMTVVQSLASDFMGSSHALLLDANPMISPLDHYIGGDGRANENFTLTSMHTIWARNHNFHVEKLQAAGFEGTPEQLFQAAKMVNEAEYQRVVFTEFADALIGGIQGNGSHGFEGYNDQATASISHEFAAAVYRIGHSLIGDTITVKGANGQNVSVNLFDAFLNPTNDVFTPQQVAQFQAMGYDPKPGYEQLGTGAILAGIVEQPAEDVDFNVVNAVRNDLVRIRADLFAFNVARGRDVGLGTLNQVKADLKASTDPYIKFAVEFLEANGGSMNPYSSWQDFQQRNGLSDVVLAQFIAAYPDLVLQASQIEAFKAINGNIVAMQEDGTGLVKGIDRVDLWVGGLAEKHFNGGMAGDTFWVVLHEQFDRLQEADRFYYLERFDNFDLYENFIDGQGFSDIVARNTGLVGLPEDIFSSDVEDGANGDGDGDAGEDDGDGDGQTGNDGDGEDTDNDGDVDGEDDGDDDDDDDGDGSSDGDGEDDGSGDGDDDGQGSGTDGGTMPNPVPVAALTLIGTAAADALLGAAGNDTILGGAGTDILVGQAGSDILRGEDGDDVVTGGDGDDFINAGLGDDEVHAGEGKDIVFGGAGSDQIFAGAGNDVVEGGAGDDRIWGGEGDDTVIATLNDGNDVYYGDAGIDTLDYAASSANLTVDLGNGFNERGSVAGGTTGSDTFYGFENFVGGAGHDKITASTAVNIIDGGLGDDVFKFTSAASANGDTIYGFQTGDRIDFTGMGAMKLEAGQTIDAIGDVTITHEIRDGEEFTIIRGNTQGDNAADFELSLHGRHNLTINDFLGVS